MLSTSISPLIHLAQRRDLDPLAISMICTFAGARGEHRLPAFCHDPCNDSYGYFDGRDLLRFGTLRTNCRIFHCAPDGVKVLASDRSRLDWLLRNLQP